MKQHMPAAPVGVLAPLLQPTRTVYLAPHFIQRVLQHEQDVSVVPLGQAFFFWRGLWWVLDDPDICRMVLAVM